MSKHLRSQNRYRKGHGSSDLDENSSENVYDEVAMTTNDRQASEFMLASGRAGQTYGTDPEQRYQSKESQHVLQQNFVQNRY